MVKYLLFILLIPFSNLFSSNIESDKLPVWAQNKKWVNIYYYGGQYQKYSSDDHSVNFITGIDSVEYVSSSGESFNHKWSIEKITLRKDGGLVLFDNKDSYYEFTWLDKDRGIAEWRMSHNSHEYNETEGTGNYNAPTHFLVVDSMSLNLLPELYIDTTAIRDVNEYIHQTNSDVEEVIADLTGDYNKDGIVDRIFAYREYAYEDNINHSHRYYYILFFLGNPDGTFRTNGKMYREVQKPGVLTEVTAEAKNCRITISNIPDQENYDPFENLDARFGDFDFVVTKTEVFHYCNQSGNWQLVDIEEVIERTAKIDNYIKKK